MKILFLAVNPVDTQLLQLDEEIHEIESSLRKSDLRDSFEVEKQFAVRAEELQGLFLRYRPDIVHFAGHGNEQGEILFKDSRGHSCPVSAEALSSLFRVLRENIRCVVLNACYTTWQAEAIAQHIDTVIYMSRAIEDKAASKFAAGFYEGLGNGCSVLQSFELGKVQIGWIDINAKDIPQLLEHGNNPDETPPYQGLNYYDVKDANRFFGREQWIASLVGYLREGNQFLAIIGASGSGKSSLVRAGLIPALQKVKPLSDGTFPPISSERWQWRIVEPSPNPLRTLAKALLPSDKPEQALQLAEGMSVDLSRLSMHLRYFVQHNDCEHVLLIIDQFENLFMQCDSHDQQQAFISNLLIAAKDGIATVVITLRADFYHHCADFDDLRVAVERHQRYINSMAKDELRNVIEKSAKFGHWELETGLVDLLLDDAAAEPGALPLLSHALLETWNRRVDRKLTMVGYINSGRVHGAIAQTAEKVLKQKLTQEEQKIAKDIFLQLTELNEGGQFTRRRIPLSDLVPNADRSLKVENCIQVLENARLLTTSQEPSAKDRDPNLYIDVTHEALIREWQTLRDWINENREDLRIRRHLQERAKEWENRHRDHGELYRGLRLQHTLAWAAEHADEITEVEKAFLDTSEREYKQAQQKELLHTRRERNWAWTAFAAAFIALIFAMIVGGQLYIQNRKSQIERFLTEAREAKLALEADHAIDSLHRAEEAAKEAGVNLGLDMQVEIEDVIRSVATKRVQQGEQFTKKGDFKGAAEEFRKALALDPPSDVPIYVWIERGNFIMGTSDNANARPSQKANVYGAYLNPSIMNWELRDGDNEKPQQIVYTDGFWILRTEVTNHLYLRCVQAGICSEPRSTHWSKPQFAKWPVSGIDWEQADTYAQWVGGRLPTEAEWEKACRGTDGRLYPWGNELPSLVRLNFGHNDIYEIASVGSYSPGANSLYDMAGNVYEWTSSIYQTYPYKAKEGRKQPTKDSEWVYRGGSFSSSDFKIRCAFRAKKEAGIIDNSVGFRVVLPSH